MDRGQPWRYRADDLLAHLGNQFGIRQPSRREPRGTYNSKQITALAERHGLTGAAQPEDVFYPVHPRMAERLWDPTFKLADVVTERTLAIHLWNEKLRELKKIVPPEGSIMAELLARYPV